MSYTKKTSTNFEYATIFNKNVYSKTCKKSSYNSNCISKKLQLKSFFGQLFYAKIYLKKTPILLHKLHIRHNALHTIPQTRARSTKPQIENRRAQLLHTKVAIACFSGVNETKRPIVLFVFDKTSPFHAEPITFCVFRPFLSVSTSAHFRRRIPRSCLRDVFVGPLRGP